MVPAKPLNILLVTNCYAPSVGGVETASRLLGEALLGAGHSVTVLTRSRGDWPDPTVVAVVRRPSPFTMLALYKSAEAVILQGRALRLGWPLLLMRRAALLVHHALTSDEIGPVARRMQLKLFQRCRHATVSQAMSARLSWRTDEVLPNPYDGKLFRPNPEQSRIRDIIFVGRLVLEKGADVLLNAMALLRRQGVRITGTIVGAGPQSVHLTELAKASDLGVEVSFAGQVTGPGLAHLLHQHKILVVPSSCEEPFGIVALEAIGCGCGVVASNVGGLPEAVGPCGVLFRKDDAADLAERLRTLLRSERQLEIFRARGPAHLAKHQPEAVARRYLDHLAVGPRMP